MSNQLRSLVVAAAALLAAGASAQAAPPNQAATITVHKSTTYQDIWGFGAAANHPVNELKNNYTTTTQNAILDTLFSDDNTNAGLSMVRLEINPFTAAQDPVQTTFNPSPGTIDWNTDLHQRWFAEVAQSRGVGQFIAVPWSPPGWMKTNGSPYNGGHLLSTHYDTFADYVKTYVDQYRNGFAIPITHVSIQNEPDLATTYASCQYTNSEMDVVAGKVADAVHSLNQGVLVGAPEGSNMTVTNAMTAALSQGTMDKLDFVVGHEYGNVVTINGRGKPVIMTEVSNFTVANDSSITDGLVWGNRIAAALKRGEKGWFYWWAVAPVGETTGQGLIHLLANDQYLVNKRLYVMGQFSRYLRPGDTRVLAASNNSNLVSVAGTNATGRAGVVIINNSRKAISTTVSGLTFGQVAWRQTSSEQSMTDMGSYTVSGGAVTVTLPAKSVNSFMEW